MNILIAGGTGYIGREITKKLLADGHEITILTRDKERASDIFINSVKFASWTDIKTNPLNIIFYHFDCIINLSGEPIAAKKWSNKTKEKIMSSRIKATKKIVFSLKQKTLSAKVLINASAIGYYGPHGDEVLNENAGNGDDFLSKVCRRWEAAAMEAEQYGVRVVMIRTGVVIGSEGALQRMIKPFRFFAGGTIGSGKQYVSWIHISDLVKIYLFAAHNNQISGPVNATAPNPVSMLLFTQTLAKILRKPAFLKIPAFFLKAIYGEMSNVLLNGQNVIPSVLVKSGFLFDFSSLDDALRNIIKENID
jgi:uncharacterized protein (TIGR01777 family)